MSCNYDKHVQGYFNNSIDKVIASSWSATLVHESVNASHLCGMSKAKVATHCPHHMHAPLEYVCGLDHEMMCSLCASSTHASHGEKHALVEQSMDLAIQAHSLYNESIKIFEMHISEVNGMRTELQMIHDKVRKSLQSLEIHKQELLGNIVKEIDNIGIQWLLQENSMATELAHSIDENTKYESELGHYIDLLEGFQTAGSIDTNEKVLLVKHVIKSCQMLLLLHRRQYLKLKKPYPSLVWPSYDPKISIIDSSFIADSIETNIEKDTTEAETETTTLMGLTPRISYFSVSAAGQNNYGQLGPDCEPFAVHTLLFGAKDVKKMQASYRGYCMYLNNRGEVYSKGNGNGYLGIGDMHDHKVFLQLEALDGFEITDLSCGWEHTLMRTNQGDIFVFGSGKDGQLVITLFF